MPKQFFCPHCEHCCRLQEAAKPFVPKMKSFPEFPSLPAANLLSVYQKLLSPVFEELVDEWTSSPKKTEALLESRSTKLGWFLRNGVAGVI